MAGAVFQIYIFGCAHKLFFFFSTLIQEKFVGKKIMGKVLLSGNGSAFGSTGRESHVLRSLSGKV